MKIYVKLSVIVLICTSFSNSNFAMEDQKASILRLSEVEFADLSKLQEAAFAKVNVFLEKVPNSDEEFEKCKILAEIMDNFSKKLVFYRACFDLKEIEKEINESLEIMCTLYKHQLLQLFTKKLFCMRRISDLKKWFFERLLNTDWNEIKQHFEGKCAPFENTELKEFCDLLQIIKEHRSKETALRFDGVKISE